jgi:hypothetical protein
MRFLSTRAHGMLDYLTGGLLIVVPWLFGFADGSAVQWVPVGLGTAIILVSLITGYELGLANVIPMQGHLALDGIAGLLLAISPWAFGFADRTYWPHLIIGIAEIGLSCVTRTQPDVSRAVAMDRYKTDPRRC